MSFVNISRESSSKLTVEFPSHTSQHEVCEGPVTVLTFGQTLTIDTTLRSVRIDLPVNRSVIEIYYSEKKLVCSWESTAPGIAEDSIRSKRNHHSSIVLHLLVTADLQTSCRSQARRHGLRRLRRHV